VKILCSDPDSAVTNANGQVVQYDYCGCGSPNTITRWNGSTQLVTQLNYDLSGRVTNTFYPGGYQLTREYGSDGFPSKISDNAGHILNIDWQQFGVRHLLHTAGTTDGANEATLVQYDYDEYGRATNSVDENVVSQIQTYDYLDRVLTRQSVGASTDPITTGIERFKYDARGLTNYTDALGKVTHFVRDTAGRVLFQTNANLEVLAFTYNPAGQLLSLRDYKQQTTRWNYDVYGRVTNKVDNSSNEMFVYGYDANDRLRSRKTPEKGMTYYGYDPIGNLTNVAYPAFTNSLRYDDLNRLVGMTDQVGITSFGWTNIDQVACL
jgi:YD repeat-containing protein